MLRKTGLLDTSSFHINKRYYPYFTYKKSKYKSKGTIFFIHGYAFDSSYHDFFANLIDDYDYYAVELPGHGITPVKKSSDLSPIEYAKLVANLIVSLKLKNVHLLGHSMGGGIAMMVNQLIPNLIKDMILVCPMNSFGTTNVYDFLFHFNPKTYKQAERFYKIVLHDKHWVEDEWAKYIIDHMLYINKTYKKNFQLLKLKIASLKNIIDLAKAENKLGDKKILLMVGLYDHCINSKTTILNLSKHAKNLNIIKFENSGHIPMFEELGKYANSIISFLNDE